MREKFHSFAGARGVLGSLLVLTAGPLWAQASAPAAVLDAASPKIAVIDMGKVSAQSLLGKSYAAKLEQLRDNITAERTKKQNELNKLEGEIKTLQEEMEKQQSVLSPEAVDNKRKILTRKARERQALIEDGQADIQRLTEKAQRDAQKFNQDFQKEIQPHIAAIVKQKAIDILLDAQVVLSINKAFDVSQDVIVLSDAAQGQAKGGGGGGR